MWYTQQVVDDVDAGCTSRGVLKRRFNREGKFVDFIFFLHLVINNGVTGSLNINVSCPAPV